MNDKRSNLRIEVTHNGRLRLPLCASHAYR